MDTQVASRYAEALYQVAASQGLVNEVESNLEVVSSALENNEAFRNFMFSPQTSREAKLAKTQEMFADRLVAPAFHIIMLMIEKRREADLSEMAEEFSRLRRENGQVLFATITSSAALDDKQRSEIVSTLRKKSGQEVEARFAVDPRLVGGVKVAYGTTVLDGTVRGRLEQIRDLLRRDVLKQA